MSAQDIAKEVVRIATTHGLAKDVIDLLEKKLALLTDELSASKAREAASQARESKLEADNNQLRGQLEDLQPVGFVESMGVLWRRTASGFESHPYCKHCAGNPIMSPVQGARKWVCGTGEHFAPFSARPPRVEPQVTGLPAHEEPLE